MDLTIDARYLDIARAGLKAPLPVEWRPCQKNKNGQQDFFYKNVQTGAVSYDHPCDLIFRKKFQDAKNLDSKGTQKKVFHTSAYIVGHEQIQAGSGDVA